MTLELQFGNKVNFDAAPTQGKHFGLMQASDAISLAIAVQSIPHLCSLSLTNSQMTDDLMRLFVNELKAKDKDKDKYNDGNSLTGIRDTLVELDLSFNKLTTDGFRQILLYFLDGDDLIHDVDDDDKKIIGAEDSILSTFKVAGNKIRAEGARTLGRILRTNASLEALDLRMNLLNDEGGQLVMNGLQHNHTLKRLNMSCNLLSSLTAEGLCRVFEMSDDSSTRSTNQLQHMDISSNEFKASDLIMLSQAVEQTCKLTSLDLRGNVFKNSGSKKITTEDALESINNKLKSNATHMKMQNR
jgi:Ran GTPase-activating protein (RanGAP) involved in mRNA processing and transport